MGLQRENRIKYSQPIMPRKEEKHSKTETKKNELPLRISNRGCPSVRLSVGPKFCLKMLFFQLVSVGIRFSVGISHFLNLNLDSKSGFILRALNIKIMEGVGKNKT